MAPQAAAAGPPADGVSSVPAWRVPAGSPYSSLCPCPTAPRFRASRARGSPRATHARSGRPRAAARWGDVRARAAGARGSGRWKSAGGVRERTPAEPPPMGHSSWARDRAALTLPFALVPPLLVFAPVALVGRLAPLTPVVGVPGRPLVGATSAPGRRGHGEVADGNLQEGYGNVHRLNHHPWAIPAGPEIGQPLLFPLPLSHRSSFSRQSRSWVASRHSRP